MIHPPVPPAAWAAEGGRVASALEEVAAALIIGRDAEACALVAIGIARAQRSDRRTAIGDLSAGAGPLRAEGVAGLVECIRDGRPISDIARPLDEDGRLFVLPAGNGDGDRGLLFSSPRWPRLIAGFREVDALLLLVATADAPGLDALIAAVDGVVAVDLPVAMTRTMPLLATVDRPEDELPPVTPSAGARQQQAVAREHARAHAREHARAARTRRRRIALTVIATGASIALVALALSRRGARPAVDATHAAPAVLADIAPSDTFTLGALVNPADAEIATIFTVELVAANTPAGANSLLATRGTGLPATTLAPVPLGSDGRPWYRALTGAWHERAEAEAFLATLRDRGTVRPTVGRVLRAPYALLLAQGVPTDEVPAALAGWAERGITAYALLQDDGRARLYVGAFETLDQSVLLAASLRDLGVEPLVAFRTGRMF